MHVYVYSLVYTGTSDMKHNISASDVLVWVPVRDYSKEHKKKRVKSCQNTHEDSWIYQI